jgi:hypothetical protein
MISGIAEGRVVRYVLTPEDVDAVAVAKNPLPEGRSVVALIVGIVGLETGVVDLTLFPNWSKDCFVHRGSALPQPVGIAWKQNVPYSEEKDAGTWHWPVNTKLKHPVPTLDAAEKAA